MTKASSAESELGGWEGGLSQVMSSATGVAKPQNCFSQFVRLSLYLTMKRMKLVSFVSSVAAVSVESLTLSTLSEDDDLFFR